MAIVQNPLTGRTKKKFGTAVFSKQFGKNTMRTKPIEVRNPKTEGQISQRTKFSTTVELVKQVIPLINEIYAGSIKTMSPFNKVTSMIIKKAFTGNPPVLDHTKVSLCDFEGSTINNVSLAGTSNYQMEITWEPNTQNPDELASPLTFVLINCETNRLMIYPSVVNRSEGSAIITAPSDWEDQMTALHVMTIDFTQFVANAPKRVLKFKAGADLASKVKK